MQLIVTNDCLLTGASPELQHELKKKLTIQNPQYQSAKKYGRWIGKKIKPTLVYYKETSRGIHFPRGFANKAVLMCKKMSGINVEIIDKRRLLAEWDFSFSAQLRPYQEKAVERVCARSFGVLEAGTGSGKTVMALAVIAKRKQPTLVIVHSKELLFQWQQRIEDFLGIESGLVGDGRFDPQPLTVAIVNTARKHLSELKTMFGHIIVDECHRVPASLFTDVVSAFDSHFMLGLSATAFRRENDMTKLIYMYMGDRVHKVEGEELAESGAVVLPQLIQKKTDFSYRFRGEYSKLIKALAKNTERNKLIASDVVDMVQKGHKGTILLVSDRVAHCQILAELLNKEGVKTDLLTGQVGKEKREQVVQDALEGRLEVLIATIQLIGEGFDCQGLSTLVLATPIKFEGRLLQVVGRVMRPAPGKKALVVDYVDANIPVLRRSAQKRKDILTRWEVEE